MTSLPLVFVDFLDGVDRTGKKDREFLLRAAGVFVAHEVCAPAVVAAATCLTYCK